LACKQMLIHIKQLIVVIHLSIIHVCVRNTHTDTAFVVYQNRDRIRIFPGWEFAQTIVT
jgi:hypothetical protein